MKELSILLGSGFSIPAGLPTVDDINSKLMYLKESDFYIWSDQRAGFYKDDYRDPNAFFSVVDRLFAEEFTTFYREKVLLNELSKFNYEIFYDYISDFILFKTDKERIHKFCDDFRNKTNSSFLDDDHNLVWRFQNLFSKLIADLLYRTEYFENVTYFNVPNYDAFFNFLIINLQSTINVHTLNHDMFFDSKASEYSGLWQHFTDGFSEHGSPYYGEVSIKFKQIHKAYKVRLKYYTGKYKNKLRLFKLHGSVDNYIIYLNSTENIRVKQSYGVTGFMKEDYNHKTEDYEYRAVHEKIEPDFLTGVTQKIREYNQPFYENLMKCFKTNLLNSNQLLVIGYGFQDKGINEYIENNYLINKKKMIVIDIKKPDCLLFSKYPGQIEFSLKSITAHTNDDFNKWSRERLD